MTMLSLSSLFHSVWSLCMSLVHMLFRGDKAGIFQMYKMIKYVKSYRIAYDSCVIMVILKLLNRWYHRMEFIAGMGKSKGQRHESSLKSRVTENLSMGRVKTRIHAWVSQLIPVLETVKGPQSRQKNSPSEPYHSSLHRSCWYQETTQNVKGEERCLGP